MKCRQNFVNSDSIDRGLVPYGMCHLRASTVLLTCMCAFYYFQGLIPGVKLVAILCVSEFIGLLKGIAPVLV
jgi:hypothetical protein